MAEIENKIVFILRESADFGIVIEPVVIELFDKLRLSTKHMRLNTQTANDYKNVMRPFEFELIEILEKCYIENLIKRFSKNNVKPAIFLAKLDPIQKEKIVMPFIQKQLNKAMQLFQNNETLFFREKENNLLELEDNLVIVKGMAQAVFNFEKLEDSTKYFLNVEHLGKELFLNQEPGFVITNHPCFLLSGNLIYEFRHDFDGKKLQAFFKNEYITVDAKNEKAYYEKFVLNTVKNHKVNLVNIEVKEIKTHAIPRIVIESNLFKTPVLEFGFQYGENRFLLSDKESPLVKLHFKQGVPYFEKVIRDVEFEESVLNVFLKNGFIFKDDNYLILENQQEKDPFTLIAWVNEHAELLKENLIIISQHKAQSPYFLGDIRMEMKSSEETNDWFDVNCVIIFGEFEIPFVEFKQNILDHNRLFVLPNEHVVVLPEEWFIRFESLFQFATEKVGTIRIQRNQKALLNCFEDAHAKTVQVRDYQSNLKDITILETPELLNAKLRTYQEQGFSWLWHLYKHGFGGCLSDDMGLGKTIQVIALFCKIKEDCKGSMAPLPVNELTLFDVPKDSNYATNLPPSLVVVPLSLVYNWQNEFKKFAPKLRVLIYTGPNRAESIHRFKYYDVVITTYGIVRQDSKQLKDLQFNYAVLDESQAIKNPASQNFKAVRLLKAYHKLIITGTPVENSLTDLWSQMTFINDGLLGGLRFFKHYFIVPVEKGNSDQRLAELHNLINPFILRRSKKEVAPDLPALHIQTYYCDMTEAQQHLYNERKTAIRNYIFDNMKADKNKSSMMILNGLLELRQLANHPKMNNIEAESGKFDNITQIIDELIAEKHKVLIFSSFVKHLSLFEEHFTKNAIKYSILTGKDSTTERQLAIDKFSNNENTGVFLISLKAGGVGLNLTSADYVLILDPWWNPAAELQAINRSHRIGQTQNVFAYKFITQNTVEEKILKLQEKKQLMIDEILENKNPFEEISLEEIKELFD